HTGGKIKTATLSMFLGVDGATDLAPAVSVPPEQAESSAGLTFSQKNGNPILLSDGDGNGATERAYLQSTGGTLTLGRTSNVTVSDNGSSLVSLSGTLAAMNAALDGLHYTPAAGSGVVLFSALVTDGMASGESSLLIPFTQPDIN